jgi:RHS repeat-associated protein
MRQRIWNNGKDSTNMIYHFDIQNRLTSVCKAQDTLFTFAYSYTGQRLLKVDKKNRITTLYVSPQYEITTTADSVYSTKYVTSPGSIVASVTHAKANGRSARQQKNTVAGLPLSGINYFHQNFVNTTNITTSATGALSAQYHYKPFGELYSVNGNADARYTFGSKEMDETGLYYFSSRYYDPVTTRFISADNQPGGSIYQSDALNRYAYTLNDPIKYYDPSGHCGCFAAFLGIGELFAAIFTGGEAIPEEIALDAALEEAEMDAGFIAGLEDSRTRGEITEAQHASLYQNKRAATNGVPVENRVTPRRAYIRGNVVQGYRGEDQMGNVIFYNNRLSEDANLGGDLELRMGFLDEDIARNPGRMIWSDDYQTIAQSLNNGGEYKFTVDVENYQLRIADPDPDLGINHDVVTRRGPGKPVYTGGYVRIQNGDLYINNHTGHYRTTEESLRLSAPIWRDLQLNHGLNFENIIYGGHH